MPFFVSILFFVFLSVEIWGGTPKKHYFNIEQGDIRYEILGGAQLTDTTSLNIHGSSRLQFKDWGEVRQEEDEGVIATKGAIRFVQEIKRLERDTGNQVITVDYEHEQLLKRTKSSTVTSEEKETDGLIRRGQDVVAGLLCAVWIAPGMKKCIYKGIVLKLESHVLGIFYVKKAVYAVFDKNSTEPSFVLPDYPVRKISLFRENIKTQKITEVKNVCKVFKDVIHEVKSSERSFDIPETIDKKKRDKFVNKIAEGIFRKQKEILPKLLFAMKKSRECLQLAEDIFERDACVQNYVRTKSTLGMTEDDYRIFSEDENKTKLLDAVEDAVIHLESRMPCIHRSKNFVSLSKCMR